MIHLSAMRCYPSMSKNELSTIDHRYIPIIDHLHVITLPPSNVYHAYIPYQLQLLKFPRGSLCMKQLE